MNSILDNFASATSAVDMSIELAVVTMLSALLLGAIIAITYYITQNEDTYQRSFAITLIMLPVILSVIIIFVGSNIARAFSLAGTLSIIRFRSAPGDAKDIGYIFFDTAAGLACGVGVYGYGALFVIVLCLVLILVEKTNAFREKNIRKILKITIAEDLNFEGVFDEILEKYTNKYKLSKIKTTDLGSLYELEYIVSMANGCSEQQFINELRCRNGNLNISLLLAPNDYNIK